MKAGEIMADGIRSYTSSSSSTASSWMEFCNLIRGVRRASTNIRQEVQKIVDEIRRAEEGLKRLYGFETHSCDMLEVGVGQLPRQIAYFARNNRVTGIDLDVIPQGFGLKQYYRLYRSNGIKRLSKTIVRKTLGVDRQFRKELARSLNVEDIPAARLLSMDATSMSFEDASFDFIYSFNVFEHLPDPKAVVEEMKRVLRPGGCILTHFHLFTSDSGGHDVRVLSGNRQGMPYWAHLRPSTMTQVRNAAYINRLRIADWENLLRTTMPGCAIEYWPDEAADHLRKELSALRRSQELQDYTDEELLTRLVVCYWKK